MIKLLRRLISSHNPVRPTDEERPEFEALFEQGFVNYAYNIELGDGYLISEKGMEITKNIEVKMNKDRAIICEIISKMLDNPDNNGIYPTSMAYDELEDYIKDVRIKANHDKMQYCTALSNLRDAMTSVANPNIVNYIDAVLDDDKHD